MDDKYIRNQKAIIRKEWNKYAPSVVISFLMLMMLLIVLIYAYPAPPGQWKNDEVVFVNAEYRTMRSLSRYPPKGYELTDQNGYRYWAGKELTWQELGKPYSILYYTQGGYRHLTRVQDQSITLINEADSIEEWGVRSGDYGLFLFIWLILMVLYLRFLYSILHSPVIKECRRRIRKHEAKMYRRALEKGSK